MGKLVWRNLTRNRLRTALTVASVGLALFLLTFLGSLLDAIEGTETSSESRVVVRHAVSLTFDMPEAYGNRLTRLDQVQAVTPLTWFGGTYKDQRPANFFPRFGADPSTLFEVFDDYEISTADFQAWRDDRGGFIAGQELIDKQGWEMGERITVLGDIYPLDLELTLRGVFTRADAPSAERQIFFHRRYLEEGLGNPGTVGTYWLKLDSADAVPSVVRAAETMFESSDAPVRAETEEAFALSFLELLGNVRLLLGSIGLAVVVSILFITANTMAMAARDRVREVAVMRTLGFQRGHVTWLVLLEAILVGGLGAMVGAGLAVLSIGALRSGLEDALPLFGTLEASPTILGGALVLGLAIGLLSGIVPAWNASRVDIVGGLRRVT
ncbi:MAG: FtsX-like permease family protein [Acidobacteriota bacterium]